MGSGQSVHLVVMWRDIPPAKLKVNDTAGGFRSVTNQLSTMEKLQNDSKRLKIERLMTDIGTLTIRCGGSERDMTPYMRRGWSEKLNLIIF